MSNTPRLDDLINEWRKDTIFKDWTYTKPASHLTTIHALGYLFPPNHSKHGLIQVWSDHVIIIIDADTITVFQRSEYYRHYLKELAPPGSNQYIKLVAADPNFFEKLGDAMEIIHGINDRLDNNNA